MHPYSRCDCAGAGGFWAPGRRPLGLWLMVSAPAPRPRVLEQARPRLALCHLQSGRRPWPLGPLSASCSAASAAPARPPCRDPAIRSAEPSSPPPLTAIQCSAARAGHQQPPPPRTRDRRRPAHEPAPSRHEAGSVARHGRASMRQTRRARAEPISRRLPAQAARSLRPTGRPCLRQRDAGGDPRTRRTRKPADW
jgi:hypothetical protein